MKLVGNAAVFLLGLLVSVPAAEAVFRVTGDAPSYDLQGLYVPFDKSYRLGPSVDTDAFWASGRVAVHTDELGLRTDSERRYGTKPGQSVGILLIGDSQGFGNGVNFEESIAGSLAAIAANHGQSVANASVGGHSLATQLRLVRALEAAHGLKPSNLVVLLTPVMLAECDQGNNAIVGSDGRLYGGEPTAGVRLRMWMKSHLVVYSRVRDAVRDSGIGVDPAANSPSVFQFYRVDERTETTKKLRRCLNPFVDYAAERNMTLHVAYLPSVVEANFESVRLAAADQGIVLDPDLPFLIYADVMGQLGLQAIDLRPTLSKVRAEGHMLNVMADFHYSAALSRAVGASLWDGLSIANRSVERAVER